MDLTDKDLPYILELTPSTLWKHITSASLNICGLKFGKWLINTLEYHVQIKFQKFFWIIVEIIRVFLMWKFFKMALNVILRKLERQPEHLEGVADYIWG